MDAITIRRAVSEDFEAIYEFINLLENEVFEVSVQRGIFFENIVNPDVIYLLAFAQETHGSELAKQAKAVGLLSCNIQNLLHHAGKVGEIQEMFVAEEARNLGVGKKLVAEIKAIARTKNVVQLEVTSSFKRDAAHRFYEREGFVFTHKKFTYPLK